MLRNRAPIPAPRRNLSSTPGNSTWPSSPIAAPRSPLDDILSGAKDDVLFNHGNDMDTITRYQAYTLDNPTGFVINNDILSAARGNNRPSPPISPPDEHFNQYTHIEAAPAYRENTIAQTAGAIVCDDSYFPPQDQDFLCPSSWPIPLNKISTLPQDGIIFTPPNSSPLHEFSDFLLDDMMMGPPQVIIAHNAPGNQTNSIARTRSPQAGVILPTPATGILPPIVIDEFTSTFEIATRFAAITKMLAEAAYKLENEVLSDPGAVLSFRHAAMGTHGQGGCEYRMCMMCYPDNSIRLLQQIPGLKAAIEELELRWPVRADMERALWRWETVGQRCGIESAGVSTELGVTR